MRVDSLLAVRLPSETTRQLKENKMHGTNPLREKEYFFLTWRQAGRVHTTVHSEIGYVHRQMDNLSRYENVSYRAMKVFKGTA